MKKTKKRVNKKKTQTVPKGLAKWLKESSPHSAKRALTRVSKKTKGVQ